MKVAFHTLGCKVNQYESQAMQELLSRCGYVLAKDGEDPDVFVVHSCAVTAESVRKSRQILRKFRGMYPNAVMVLSGCYPQAFPSAVQNFAAADIIIGNKDFESLPQYLTSFLKDRKQIIAIPLHQKGDLFCTPSISTFSERTRAYVKIQDGCNRFCTYCIIPTARGRVRSRSLEDIQKELFALASNGFTEVVFTGINLSAFGQDTGAELCDVVALAAKIPGIQRIRLGSLEPDQISDRTLDYLASCSKFCPQFHLSLQSGCDATLKRMNRHYNTNFYAELVDRIRVRFKNASITTDIIVGFPGESEEDFAQSVAFAKSMQFAKAHIFPFSPRVGTRAYSMENQIDKSVKADRCRKMIAACQEGEGSFLQTQLGKTSAVLFETLENGYFTGYTENYTRVQVGASTDLRGLLKKVKLVSLQDTTIIGEVIE